MNVTKSLKQKYVFQDRNLFDEFRYMVNESIRVGIESKLTSKLSLRNLVYDRFKNNYNTYLISMAVFKAHAILKNYRKTAKKKPDAKVPYMKKNVIIIDSNNIKLTGNYIHFSTKPRQFIAINLNAYLISKLSEQGIKIGNMIIRENEIIIPYSYTSKEKLPSGYIGIDMNFENVTSFDGKENVHDLSPITSYKQIVRERLSHLTRNDHRIRKKLAQKYGKKQKDKENNFLYNLANGIVSQNKIPILEKLKYIRNHGRKGDWKGKRFRFRLNSWSRFKLQQIISYKSNENGLLVIYVNPKGTSSKCSICEDTILEENRMIRCPKCGLHIDRDINAARNILARGIKQIGLPIRSIPDAVQGEAMKQFKDAKQIVPSQFIQTTIS